MKTGIHAMAFAKIYPLYVRKAEKKGRTQEEVDTVICWLDILVDELAKGKPMEKILRS